MDRVQAKLDAKSQLKGRMGIAVGAFVILIIAQLVIQGLSMIPVFGAVIPLILAGVWVAGESYLGMRFARRQDVEIADGFRGFESFLKFSGLGIVIGIFTFLWTLLFVIPGIIKAYSYSMAYYIMLDNPDLTIMEAINKSKEITDGYKWDLFVTSLSFLGWIILAVCTFGIGFLWLEPYMQVTMANIYDQLNDQDVMYEKELVI